MSRVQILRLLGSWERVTQEDYVWKNKVMVSLFKESYQVFDLEDREILEKGNLKELNIKTIKQYENI